MLERDVRLKIAGSTVDTGALALLLVALVLSVSGCIFNEKEEKKESAPAVSLDSYNPAGEFALRYYPMEPGAVWEYSADSLIDDVNTHSNETVSCVAVSTEDDLTMFSLRYGDVEDATSSYWLNGNDVYGVIPGTSSQKAVGKPAAAEKIEELIFDEDDLRLLYRFDVPSGSSWKIFEETESDSYMANGVYVPGNEYYHYVMTGKYLGEETIESGGVVYENCKKFRHRTEFTYRYVIRDTFSAYVSSESYELTEIMYFAAGTGLVKTVRDFSYVSTDAKSSGHEELELASYTVFGASPDTVRLSSVRGRILFPDGNAAPGVRVEIEGGGVQKAAETDADGFFRFDGLDPGTYTVAITDGNWSVLPLKAKAAITNHDMDVGVFLCEEKKGLSGMPTAGADNYFPFRTGASWLYDLDEYDYESGQFERTISVSVIARGEIENDYNGKTYDLLESSDSPRYTCRRFDGDSVYEMTAHYYGEYLHEVAKPSQLSSVEKAEIAMLNELEEGLFYRLDRPARSAHVIGYSSSSEDSVAMNINLSSCYSGLETVTVEAGTFEDCLRYDIVYQVGTVADTHSGYPDMYYVNGGMTMIFTRWFAKDVGLVRETQTRYEAYEECSGPNDCTMQDSRFILCNEYVLRGVSFLENDGEN